MASLNDFAYKILLRIKPYLSDDDNIDIREIKEEIHNQRAIWLRRELDTLTSSSLDQHVQDLGCVGVEFVDSSDPCCSNLNIDSNCKILRTKVELPNFITKFSKPLITRVGQVNRILSFRISIVPYNRIPYVGNGRLNKSTIFAFYRNNRVYLISRLKTLDYTMLEYINIQGVLENPTEAADFTKCSGESCYTDDSEYPLSRKHFAYFEDIIVQKYLNTINIPTDTQNDGKEELTNNITGNAK